MSGNAFEITRASWHPERALEAGAVGTLAGVRAAGDAILKEADVHVPFETGFLEETGTVTSELTPLWAEAVVAYHTVYAAKLHEHPEYNFQNGREGKWLEHAVHAAESSVEAIEGEELKRLL